MNGKETQGLPNAKSGQIVDLVEKLSILGGSADKDGLAHALGIRTQSLWNPLRATELLGFIAVEGNTVKLTSVGRNLDKSQTSDRPAIFRKQLLQLEPFGTIHRALQKEPELDPTSLLRLVKAKMKAARRWKKSTGKEMLRMIINWGEYGKLFEYDDKTGKVRVINSVK